MLKGTQRRRNDLMEFIAQGFGWVATMFFCYLICKMMTKSWTPITR